MRYYHHLYKHVHGSELARLDVSAPVSVVVVAHRPRVGLQGRGGRGRRGAAAEGHLEAQEAGLRGGAHAQGGLRAARARDAAAPARRALRAIARYLRASPLQVELSVMLTPWLDEYGYTGFSAVSADGIVLAGNASEVLGAPSLAMTHVDMERLLANGVTLSAPYISDDLGEADEHGLLERPLMHAVSLIQDGEDLLGYLVFDLDPRLQYTATFQVGRTGASGDTFVVENTSRGCKIRNVYA